MSKTGCSHMGLTERIEIQKFLDTGTKVTDIAKSLDKSPSTIKREIDHNSRTINRTGNDCMFYGNCKERSACDKACNHKLCKYCKSTQCYEYCSDYIKSECEILNKSPGVCNACNRYSSCRYEKRVYRANFAEEKYITLQRDRSTGFNLSQEELQIIDETISPLIKQGQSPHAALIASKDKIPISESTLYRIIDSGLISARNIDLPEKVSRRPSKLRKRKNKDVYAIMTQEKQGHMYSDYLDYTSKHDIFTVEMDCVEGKKSETEAILTLHWRVYHMQLYFIMDYQDTKRVIEVLDMIEITLGLEMFRECFPVILTDNGHEFADIEGMENSRTVPGEKRTIIFFCEPNRSDQKGSAERNHRLLRKICPKGKPLKGITQPQMTLATNHINSYIRGELGNASPYDMAMNALPNDFFTLLALEKIPYESIILKPSFLKLSE